MMIKIIVSGRTIIAAIWLHLHCSSVYRGNSNQAQSSLIGKLDDDGEDSFSIWNGDPKAFVAD